MWWHAGTGRFTTFVRDNYPYATLTVSDLSPFYLEKAREELMYWEAPNRSTSRRTGLLLQHLLWLDLFCFHVLQVPTTGVLCKFDSHRSLCHTSLFCTARQNRTYRFWWMEQILLLGPNSGN